MDGGDLEQLRRPSTNTLVSQPAGGDDDDDVRPLPTFRVLRCWEWLTRTFARKLLLNIIVNIMGALDLYVRGWHADQYDGVTSSAMIRFRLLMAPVLWQGLGTLGITLSLGRCLGPESSLFAMSGKTAPMVRTKNAKSLRRGGYVVTFWSCFFLAVQIYPVTVGVFGDQTYDPKEACRDGGMKCGNDLVVRVMYALYAPQGLIYLSGTFTWWWSLKAGAAVASLRVSRVLDVAQRTRPTDGTFQKKVAVPSLDLAQRTMPLLSHGWGTSWALISSGLISIAVGSFAGFIGHESETGSMGNPIKAGIGILLVLCIPLAMAADLASVSSECDSLQRTLNERRIAAVTEPGDAFERSHNILLVVEDALGKTNAGQGMGFTVLSVVLGRKMLGIIFAGLCGLATTGIPILLALRTDSTVIGTNSCDLSAQQVAVVKVLVMNANASCSYNQSIDFVRLKTDDDETWNQQANVSASVLEYVSNLTATQLYPKYCNTSSPKVHWDVGHQDVLAFCSALHAMLWQLGGQTDDALASRSKEALTALVAQANATRSVDFFTSYPMARAFQLLRDGTKLSSAEAAAAQAMVEKTFKPALPGSNNQHYQRAAGLALAAQLFPKAKKTASWTQYAKAVMKLVSSAGDITEDAPNYNKIDFVFLWVIADVLGEPRALEGKSFKAMFARFACQISPSGAIASYGDSGSANKAESASNFTGAAPWSNDWDGFVAGFVRAATVYKPPYGGAFAQAAQTMLTQGRLLQPRGAEYGDVGMAFRLLFAVQWGSAERMPAPDAKALDELAGRSAVLTRRDIHSDSTPDKVVMRGGGAGAFLVSDLYGSEVPVPPHAHENQHGQVNWYEYGSFPLTSSLGYDNRGPADTNLLLIRDASSSFPHAVPKFKNITWIHASVPTSRMRPDAKTTRVTLTHLTLRIEWDGSPIVFSAAEFALSGSGGKLDLKLFDDVSRWRGPKGLTLKKVKDAAGEPSIEFSLPKGKGGQAGAIMLNTVLPNVTVDTLQFSSIVCNWKISNNRDTTRTFIIRLTTDSNPQLDYHASELNFAPVLGERALLVETAAASNDSIAFIPYSSWFAYDHSLNRTMLLAADEGVVLVQDSLDVGASAVSGGQALAAGPIWHFSPTVAPLTAAATTVEPGWAMSQGSDINLFVALDLCSTPAADSADEALEVGVQTVDVWSKDRQRTAYGRTALTSAGRRCFVSLLVPNRASDLRGQGHRSFTTAVAKTESGGVIATVSWPSKTCAGSAYCGTKLELVLGASGADDWSVKRTQLTSTTY